MPDRRARDRPDRLAGSSQGTRAGDCGAGIQGFAGGASAGVPGGERRGMRRPGRRTRGFGGPGRRSSGAETVGARERPGRGSRGALRTRAGASGEAREFEIQALRRRHPRTSGPSALPDQAPPTDRGKVAGEDWHVELRRRRGLPVSPFAGAIFGLALPLLPAEPLQRAGFTRSGDEDEGSDSAAKLSRSRRVRPTTPTSSGDVSKLEACGGHPGPETRVVSTEAPADQGCWGRSGGVSPSCPRERRRSKPGELSEVRAKPRAGDLEYSRVKKLRFSAP